MRIDLNLLRIFLFLFDERSASKAAERAGLTQPAMSHALNRLRAVVGDRLFTRGPGGMVPTQLALEMEPEVRAALGQLVKVFQKPPFDPAVTRRRFTIAIGPYLNELLGLPLLARLTEAAPFCQFNFFKNFEHLVNHIDRGFVDVAMAGFDAIPSHFGSEILFFEEMVWVAGRKSPLQRSPSLDDLLAQSRICVTTARSPFSDAEVEHEGGLQHRVAIRPGMAMDGEKNADSPPRISVFDNVTAMRFVAAAPFVTILPRRLVEQRQAELSLRVFPVPTGFECLPMHLVWGRDREFDPGLAWLRQIIREVTQSVLSPDK